MTRVFVAGLPAALRAWNGGAWVGGGASSPAPIGGASMPGIMLPRSPRYAVLDVNPGNFAATMARADALVAESVAVPPRGRMIEYRLAPGVYPWAPQGFCYVHSVTGVPGDVAFESSETGGGTLHLFGGPSFYKDVTFRAKPDPAGGGGPKYPLHASSGGSNIFVRCLFDAQTTNSAGGGATVGLDGADFLNLVFWECTFSNRGGWLTNLHGGTTNTAGLDISFIDCNAVAGTSKVLGYNTLGSASVDTIHLIGGNLEMGALGGGVLNTDFWPVPIGGLSTREKKQMGITDF